MQLATIKIAISNNEDMTNEVDNRIKRVQQRLQTNILSYNYFVSLINEVNELNKIKEENMNKN